MAFTVRHVLDKKGFFQAFNRIDTMVKNNISFAMVEAVTKIRFLFANMVNDLKAVMDESFERLDVVTKNNIDYLMSALHGVEEGMHDHITESINRLTHAAAIGGYKPNTPLLLSIEPACIIRTSEVGNKIFKLVGHFPNVGALGLKPSLFMNGHKATLVKPLHGECSFSIPQQALFAGNTDVCVAEVEIPYECLNFGRDVYRYKLLIGILPSSPGVIVVEHSKAATKREFGTTPSKSIHFHLASGKNYGRQDQNQLCKVETSPGWKILHESRQLQIHHNTGDTSLQLESANDTEVAYKAITYHRNKKRACGELRFTVSFTEYRDIEIIEPPSKTPVQFEWNQSQLFDYPPNTWQVVFTPFDQPFPRRFLGPTLSDPLIAINYEGQGVRISAKDPTKIKRLQVSAELPEGFDDTEPDPTISPILTHGFAFASGFGLGYYCYSRRARL